MKTSLDFRNGFLLCPLSERGRGGLLVTDIQGRAGGGLNKDRSPSDRLTHPRASTLTKKETSIS